MSPLVVFAAVVMVISALATGVVLLALPSRPPVAPQRPCTHSRVVRAERPACDDTVLDGVPFRVIPDVPGNEGWPS